MKETCWEYFACKKTHCPKYENRDDNKPCWSIEDTCCGSFTVDCESKINKKDKEMFCNNCYYYKAQNGR